MHEPREAGPFAQEVGPLVEALRQRRDSRAVGKSPPPAFSVFSFFRVFKHRILPFGGTRRVGGLLGVAGRLSGTVSPFRAYH